MIEKLLQQLADPKIVASLVAALLIGVGVMLRYYARPRIGYRAYRDPRHYRLWRYLIHNLEPVAVRGDLVVVVDSISGIERIEIFAGIHVNPAEVARVEPDEDGRVRLTFHGFPPEAVFALVVKTEQDYGEPMLYVDEAESQVHPRHFGKLSKFGTTKIAAYFFPRWALGLVLGLTCFAVGLGIVGGPVSGSDLVCLIMLVVASGLAFALALPISGKETVQGYLGWDMPTTVWQRPGAGALHD